MRDIEVPDGATLQDLATLTGLSQVRLIRAAFDDLGRLLTTNDVLDFNETRALLAQFGFSAHLKRE